RSLASQHAPGTVTFAVANRVAAVEPLVSRLVGDLTRAGHTVRTEWPAEPRDAYLLGFGVEDAELGRTLHDGPERGVHLLGGRRRPWWPSRLPRCRPRARNWRRYGTGSACNAAACWTSRAAPGCLRRHWYRPGRPPSRPTRVRPWRRSVPPAATWTRRTRRSP